MWNLAFVSMALFIFTVNLSAALTRLPNQCVCAVYDTWYSPENNSTYIAWLTRLEVNLTTPGEMIECKTKCIYDAARSKSRENLIRTYLCLKSENDTMIVKPAVFYKYTNWIGKSDWKHTGVTLKKGTCCHNKIAVPCKKVPQPESSEAKGHKCG